MIERRLIPLLFLSFCFLSLPVTDMASAQEKGGKANDGAGVDKKIYDVLREVINQGADLYNSGDTTGCYRLYAGALMTAKPLLDHHPELQKAIEDGMKEAEQTPQVFQRAFVLRRVLDKIRADVKQDKSAPPVAKETTVKGMVTVEGKPLKVGTLYFVSGEGGIQQTKVTDGAFSTTALKAGKYKVSIMGADVGSKFTDPEKSGLVFTVKEGSNVIDVAVKKDTPPPPMTANVVGSVTVDGKPVDAAKVTLVDADKKTTSATTGKDGTFIFTDLKPGKYSVAVDAKGADAKYKDATSSGLTLDVKAATYKADLKLEKAAPPPPPAKNEVKGKVAYDGKPLAGTVFFTGADKVAHEAKIGADGSYSFADLKPGAYKVALDSKGIPAKYTDAEKSGLTATVKAGSDPINFDLKKEATPPPPPPPAKDEGKVMGKVQAKGKPLAGGEIFFVDAKGGITMAKIAPDGTYTIAALPVGKYKVAVDEKGLDAKYKDPEKSAITVEVKKGDNSLDFDLK